MLVTRFNSSYTQPMVMSSNGQQLGYLSQSEWVTIIFQRNVCVTAQIISCLFKAVPLTLPVQYVCVKQ